MASPRDINNQNKNPFNFLSKLRTYLGGANTSVTPEILGLNDQNGQYIDARNARFDDEESDSMGLSKISGEQVKYDLSYHLSDDYKCICFAEVNAHLFTVWASPTFGNAPCIFIDNILVCQNTSLGFDHRHHIQFDYNNNEVGEIYLTDNYTVPIYFEIKDLLDNQSTQKYFTDFKRSVYEINFSEANSLIVFDGLLDTGGGLPVGKYSYAFRYINDNSVGSLSIWTPNITIPVNIDNTSSASNPEFNPYPKVKTYGAAPSPISSTPYAPQIRLRVNNIYNYSYIEIVRCSYNTGSGINSIGSLTIVKRIPVSNGQIGVITYVDNSANSNENISLSQDAINSVVPSIKRAKAIKYFYNKIILGNIEYEDRTVKQGVNFDFFNDGSGNAISYPILKDLGINGLKDAFENCYHTPYMNGEDYGFNIVFRDATNSKTFAAEIKGLESFQFPNRRDEMTSDSIAGSDSSSLVSIASVDGNILPVYECVDHTNMNTKDQSFLPPYRDVHNSNANDKVRGSFNLPNPPNSALEPQYRINWNMAINICSSAVSQCNDLQYAYSYRYNPSFYGYSPLKPVKISDTNNNYNIPPQTGVFWQGVRTEYNPALFQPRYNSLGLQIKGLTSWPDWATSFQIVRTKRAGKVIAQGLGFWNVKTNGKTVTDATGILTPHEENPVYNPLYFQSKLKNTFSFHIPDSDAGMIDPAIVNDIIQNPQNYSVQLVAPLGLGEEVYNYFSASTGLSWDDAYPSSNPIRADRCVYARVQREHDGKRVNPTEAATAHGIPIGGDGYIGYGKWIGNIPPFVFAGNTNGNHVFSIQSFFQDTSENGANIFNLELNEDIYSTENFLMCQMYSYASASAWDETEQFANWFDYGDNTGYPSDTDPPVHGVNAFWPVLLPSDNNRNFMEPVYIVNIIKTGQSVAQTDYNTFVQTGCNILLKSTILVSDGITSRIEICGERLEDCCSFYSQSDDNYIWVDILNDGNYQRYIDITYKSGIQIALINNDIANNTNFYNGEYLFGTYTIDLINTVQLGNNIVPKYLLLNTIPAINCNIQCRYDNRYPIKVFGGDTYVGEALAPIINRQSAAGGQYDNPATGYVWPAPDGDILATTIGFPYNNIELNEQIARPNKVDTSHGYIQTIFYPNDTPNIGYSQTRLSSTRQVACMYTCQCYGAIHLDYSEKFPNVHYVMRPGDWDPTKAPSAQNIYPQYELDYPNEISKWQFGGLRMNNGLINSDFAVQPIHDFYTSGSQFAKTNYLYRNRIAWSITRPIESFQSPSLRLFPALNIYDINDATGEIKKLYSEATQYYGENIYAFTEDDIAMLMTQKTILSGANGAQIAAQDSGSLDASFITKQLWFGNKKMGALQDEMWMTCGDSGKGIFFYNKNSAFLFKDNTLVDILQEYNYFNSVNNRLLKRLYDWQFTGVSPTDLFTGVYNRKKKEYLFGAKLQIQDVPYEDPTVFTLNCNVQGSINRNVFSIFPLSNRIHTGFNNTSYEVDTFYVKIMGIYSADIYDQSLSTFIMTANPGDVLILEWNLRTRKYTVRLLQNSFEYRDNYLFSLSDKTTKKAFNGVFDWNYEKYYSSLQQNLFGVKNQKIYIVDSGDELDGEPLIFEAINSTSPVENKSVEFARISVSSDVKPTSIDFYQDSDITTVIATLDGALLKNYNSFENYIPRNTLGNRLQGNFQVYNVKHNSYGAFKLKFVDMKFKVIK